MENAKKILRREDPGAWNPYIAGSLAGLLIIGSVALSGAYFGASSSFTRFAGFVERIFSPERFSGMQYFLKYPPEPDWQWMFVVGIFFGSLISSVTSGSFRIKSVPDTWEQRFGRSPSKRGMVAFTGGLIAMFGARLADG
jgi:uncharacterized protein